MLQSSVIYGEPVLWDIDGDEASVFMGGKRVRFERVDGRWYRVEEWNVARTVSAPGLVDVSAAAR